MSTETNKAVVARYFNELMNTGKLATIDEIAAPDFAFHITTLPEPIRGPEGLRQFTTGLRTAFPDIRFTIVQTVAEGDKVAARWTLTGTQKGEFLGFPASGNKVSDHGIDIFHLRDGKIVEMWVNEDSMGLLKQMGVIR